jgi:hypothetical protein
VLTFDAPVLLVKDKLYREIQSARVEASTRHERRIEESAKARELAAEISERQFRCDARD